MLTSSLRAPDLLLLDTHVWVWASNASSELTKEIAREIEHAALERRLLVSAASVWEIGLKAQKGELLITGDLRSWVREQRRFPGVRLLPITASLAIEATELPEWIRKSDKKPHKDPADRFLVAEARRQNATLVTRDRLILDYARRGHVRAFNAH